MRGRRVNLGVVPIPKGIAVKVPVFLVLSDILTQGGLQSPVESFNLPVGLGVVRSNVQIAYPHRAADRAEELSIKFSAVVG